ncbi:hypothetical protein [Psychrobacter sp. ANT_H59]|uniref:hypothetical protein n=1 Tax=Psychrobacter sp. ANT_H59 TaxID=2597354 RepID=UPI0021D0469A|nr:hypothetical protein [Psychrobacter sp. ANT_H59]
MQDINDWNEPYSYQTNPLRDFITSENTEKVIQKLRSQIDWSSGNYQPLILSIAQVGDIIPDTRTFLSFNPLVQSVVLIADMIINTGKNKQINIAKLTLDNAPTLEYQIELFRWLYHSENENPKPDCFSSEERKELGEYLGNKVFSEIENIDITSEKPDLVSRIFWILSEYADKNRLNGYVKLLVSSDPATVYRILNDYVPTFTSLTNGTTGKEGFDEATYKSLSKIIDISILFESIEQSHPDLIVNLNEYPTLKSRDEDRELIIPQQFIWLYRKDFSRNIFYTILELDNFNRPYIKNVEKFRI